MNSLNRSVTETTIFKQEKTTKTETRYETVLPSAAVVPGRQLGLELGVEPRAEKCRESGADRTREK